MARELYPATFYTRSLKNHPIFSMQKELSKLFDDFAGTDQVLTNGGGNTFSPRLDIHDNESDLLITAEIPGIEEKDIDLTIKEGHLFISGEKKSVHEEKSEGRKYIERSYGSFERVVALPENIKEDEVDAVFKNGILEIRIPKQEPQEPQHKKIKVRAS
jgi:HSP20 family protein